MAWRACPQTPLLSTNVRRVSVQQTVHIPGTKRSSRRHVMPWENQTKLVSGDTSNKPRLRLARYKGFNASSTGNASKVLQVRKPRPDSCDSRIHGTDRDYRRILRTTVARVTIELGVRLTSQLVSSS